MLNILLSLIFLSAIYSLFQLVYCNHRMDKLREIRLWAIYNAMHLLDYMPDYEDITIFNFWYPNREKIIAEAETKYQYYKVFKN